MTPPVAFAFADPARRTWLALNRAGDAFHIVTPTPDDAQLITDGLRHKGQLSCSCAGGRYRGTCYVTVACEAIEQVHHVGDPDPNWFDGPPGEAAEAFGK